MQAAEVSRTPGESRVIALGDPVEVFVIGAGGANCCPPH